MSPFFSIIIPIYNVSRFILKGINYVLNQSYKNYEILLVDDGSSDDSGKLCNELSLRYENIRCFHQNNRGSGPARNLGIKEAKGKYIVFFDIDDMVENSLLQSCYEELNSNNRPDVLMFSYDSYDEKYKTLTPSVFHSLVCHTNNDIKANFVNYILGGDNINGFVWNKVYKREFLLNNNIFFPELLIEQDQVFNLFVYKEASSLVISSKILYHYIIYDRGNTRSRFIPNRFNIYNSVKEEFLNLYNYWDLNDQRMLIYIYIRFFNAIIETLNFNNTHKSSKLNKTLRKQDFKKVFESEITADCIDNLEQLKTKPVGFFKKSYYNAIKTQNIVLYKILRFIEHSLKSLKWNIKKHFI